MAKSIFYITIVALILSISKTTNLPVDYFLVFLTIYFAVMYQKMINIKVLILFGSWVLINLLSYFYFGRNPNWINVLVYGCNFLILPFYLLYVYKFSILNHLERCFFILTLISIPLFILNITFESQFNSLAPILSKITNPNLVKGSPVYWTIGFYTNGIRINYADFSLLRNCGFMWEPGYFGVIIIWSIIFNWLTKGVILNKRFWIYALALITTFSTSSYFALLVLFIAFAMRMRISVIRFMLLAVLLVFFFANIYSLDFMSGKIEKYNANTEHKYVNELNSIKLNRFQIGLYDIQRIAKYPLGYGLNNRISLDGEVDVTGVNGLSGLLIMWGIPAFFILLYLLYKYLKLLNLANNKNLLIGLFYISLLIVFMSQDIQRNILFYLLIISPIVLKQNNEKKYIRQI